MNTATRLTLVALLSLTLAPCVAIAQGEKPAKPEPEAPAAPSQPRPPKPEPQPFKLMLGVKEWDAGKTILEKSYTLIMIADDDRNLFDNLRDGERIPYQGEKAQVYEDVGTNVDVNRPIQRGETLIVPLTVTSSSLVATANSNTGSLPQLNRWSISVVAVLLPGKPTVVYSATDATTGHKVEIQATAQPLNAK